MPKCFVLNYYNGKMVTVHISKNNLAKNWTVFLFICIYCCVMASYSSVVSMIKYHLV